MLDKYVIFNNAKHRKVYYVNIIQKKRIHLNLTQKDLAKMIGVDRTAVGKWELGQAVPRTKHLLALAKILDCSIEEIYYAKKQKNKNNISP